MKKKFLLPLLMIGLLFSCNGKNSKTAENTDNNTNTPTSFEEDEQGLAYYPLDDGTYGVGFGNAYYLSNIVVPSTHNGRNVTKVINYGFSADYIDQYEPTVKSITLPETITEIGRCGISYLEELESIKLPKSLKKIADCGLDGNYALKEIQYNGTEEEFNQIEFGQDWLLTEGYDEGVELSFTFKDKSVALDSLFDQLVVLNNRYVYEESTKRVETIEIQFRNNNNQVVYSFVKTSGYGNLYKRTKNCVMSIENSDIAYEPEDHDYNYVQGFTFYLHGKGAIGSTRVNFTCNNLTTSIIYNVTPDLSITVASAAQLIQEFAANRNKFYSYSNNYYCIEGYVTDIVLSEFSSYYSYYIYKANIKDSLTSQTTVAVNFRCETEITELARARFEGCRFDDNYVSDNTYDYYFICTIFATIL